jgi:hypothetical protein
VADYGIPTVYAGRQFRSRLEARWAAFFDLMRWRWEYEPFDLPGWIPDFLLCEEDILVEVKPVSDLRNEIARSTMLEMVSAARGRHEGLLILGVGPWERWGCESIGWRWNPTDGDGAWSSVGTVGPLSMPILDAWTRAGNAVQWKPPTSTTRSDDVISQALKNLHLRRTHRVSNPFKPSGR